MQAKYGWVLAGSAAMALCLSNPAEARGLSKEKKKPNIIIMMADDYGQDSAAIYTRRTQDPDFPETAPTPSLARLADQGVRFKRAWSMPACSPTRGTRSTGKLPSNSGIGWVVGRFLQYPEDGESFPPIMIDPSDPDLLQKLVKKAGYRTYKLGKWHEVVSAPTPAASVQDVLDSGFDEFYGQLGGGPGTVGGYGGSADPQGDTWRPANSLGLGPTTEFITSALVSRAIEFIEDSEDADEPYFLSLDFSAPHFAYEVAPGPNEPAPADNTSDWRTLDPVIHRSVIDQVKAAYRADFQGDYPPAGTVVPNTDIARRRAAFKSLVAYMDVQIGRLMEHVDLGCTYVLFLGDNGTQGRRFPQFAVVEAPNDPERSKGTLYHNGIEVPFVMAGPEVYWKGRTTDALVTSTDIYATVLDIVGQRQPRATRRDSFSFLNVLRGGWKSRRKFNVAEVFNSTRFHGGVAAGPLITDIAGGRRATDGRVISDGRFRLIASPVFSPYGYDGVPDTEDDEDVFVCRRGSAATPADDCFNYTTGVYEKEVVLEFFDTKRDPLEKDGLVFDEMSRWQRRRFKKLCRAINKVSKRARYFMNGKICEFDGRDLVDTDPV